MCPTSDHPCPLCGHRKSEPSSGRLTRALGYFPASGAIPRSTTKTTAYTGAPGRRGALAGGAPVQPTSGNPRTGTRDGPSREGAACGDARGWSRAGTPTAAARPPNPRPFVGPAPPRPDPEDPPGPGPAPRPPPPRWRSRGVRPGGGTGLRCADLGSRSAGDLPGLRDRARLSPRPRRARPCGPRAPAPLRSRSWSRCWPRPRPWPRPRTWCSWTRPERCGPCGPSGGAPAFGERSARGNWGPRGRCRLHPAARLSQARDALPARDLPGPLVASEGLGLPRPRPPPPSSWSRPAVRPGFPLSA